MLDPPVSPADHRRGRADAPAVLTVYGDFECPFCQAAQGILKRVEKRMGDDVATVFRHFPLDEVHPQAREAAQAAEAAAAQDAFWPAHDALYALRGQLDRRRILRAFAELGLDTARVGAELEAGTHLEHVQADEDGGRRSGVTGTPGFFVGGELLTGAFDASSLVDALRASVA